MPMERIVVPFHVETKGLADDASNVGMIEGYGSVFGNIDLGNDIILNSAFDNTLNDYKSRNELPQMLGFHRDGNVVGDWHFVAPDENGLRVRGALWVKGDSRIEEAVKCYNIAKGTGPKGLSIGFVVKKYHYEQRDGVEIRVIEEIDLYEISIVGWAMNPQAKIISVKSLTDEDGQILDKRTVEKVLRDAGLSRRQSKAFIGGGYEALARDEQSRIDSESRDDSLELSDVLASLKQLTLKMEGK